MDYLETLTEPVALILKNIKKIGTEAFSGMKAESLEIPETVEYADASFKQIQGLNSVSINCAVGPEWSGAFNNTDFKEITINRPVSGGSGFYGGLAIYVYCLERMNINANVSSETNSNIFLLHDGYAEKTVINIAENVTEVGKISVYKYYDPDTGSYRDINYDNYEINFADKNKWTVDGVSVDVDTLDAKKMFLSGKVFVKQQ